MPIWSAYGRLTPLDRQGLLLHRGHPYDLSLIDDWLRAEKRREYLAVGTVDATPNALLGDIDNFDELMDLARRADRGGEFAVLPLSELLGGLYVPRLHLINAERANERGEVPSDKAEASAMARGPAQMGCGHKPDHPPTANEVTSVHGRQSPCCKAGSSALHLSQGGSPMTIADQTAIELL